MTVERSLQRVTLRLFGGPACRVVQGVQRVQIGSEREMRGAERPKHRPPARRLAARASPCWRLVHPGITDHRGERPGVSGGRGPLVTCSPPRWSRGYPTSGAGRHGARGLQKLQCMADQWRPPAAPVPSAAARRRPRRRPAPLGHGESPACLPSCLPRAFSPIPADGPHQQSGTVARPAYCKRR